MQLERNHRSDSYSRVEIKVCGSENIRLERETGNRLRADGIN